ncbi:PucR family transcriptional regulator [Peterkaempfera bronchialis]|uniref:PucR family transcriptional regulator n=1 Tax=Peterkaempfera bronchialis TaxID=2126346 RepID=UPI003C2ABF82
MDHGWVRKLAATEPVAPLTSLTTRRRAAKVIGEEAVGWGVAAGRRMAAYILGALADWPGERSEEEWESLQRATEASTLDTLTALVTGNGEPMRMSSEPTQNIIFYVTEGIPIEEVVRNVHAGQEFLTQELIGCIADLLPPEQRLEAIQATTRSVIQNWSAFASEITQIYAAESRRWQQGRQSVRMQAVRRILSGVRFPAEDTGRDLGYRLDQTHVALILWLEDLDVETARMFDFTGLARSLAAVTLAEPEPLVIRRGATRVDVWLGGAQPDAARLIEAKAVLPTPLRIAVGCPAPGVEGFRCSHEQALAARRVLRLGTADRQIVDYPDVELVSLLAADPIRARAFVRAVLGPLRQRDPRMAELRLTLAAHIDNGGSIAQTAQALHTHRNTVSYRLNQAEELLPANRGKTELRCALLLGELFPEGL